MPYIVSDCTSAIAASNGTTQVLVDDFVTKGAIGLAFASFASGQPIIAHHTRSHTGCPFNDTADWIAKSCAQGFTLPSSNGGSTDLVQAAREGLLQNFWLTSNDRFVSSQLPFLNSQGAWTSTATFQTPRTVPALPAALQPWDGKPFEVQAASLRLLQYNCLSLKGWGASELIAQSLSANHVSVAGLQETRLKKEGIASVDGYWVVSSSCTDRGAGGCQLWVRCNERAGFVWDRSALAIMHAEPQFLVVLAAAQGQQFAFFVAHAPPSDSPAHVLDLFWSKLSQLAQRAPRDSIPLFFLDANARFEAFAAVPDTLESTPACPNARHLVDLCSELAVVPTAQFDCDGTRLISWISPVGRPALLDYVLVPTVCSTAFSTLPTPSLYDFHAGVDHFPVLASCAFQFQAQQRLRERRLCGRTLATAPAKQVITEAFCSLPAIPWCTDPTTHVELIHRHLLDYLAAHLPPPPRKARHPAITPATLDLIYLRRHVRTVARVTQRLETKAVLSAWFHTWRSACDAAPTERVWRYAHRQHYNAARWAMVAGRTAKATSQAILRDKANFVRQAMEEAREDGPAQFAHRIRSILRTGRSFRTPTLLPCLNNSHGGVICGKAAVSQAFGDHFALAERGTRVSVTDLVTAAPSVTALKLPLQADSAPNVVDLAVSFASLKGGKASGLSGLPAEVFKQFPQGAALAYFPVVAKMVAWSQQPLQFTGGLAHIIPKSEKAPGELTSWRSIYAP